MTDQFTPRESFALADNPAYFGMYLNLARLNAFTTLQGIEKDLGTNMSQEDGLSHSEALNALVSTQETISTQAIERFRRSFPCLRIVTASEVMFRDKKAQPKALPGAKPLYRQDSTPTPEDHQEILTALLALLNDLRNHYSHAGQPAVLLDHKTMSWLVATFDAAVKSIREKRGLTEAQTPHLTRMEMVNRKMQEKPGFKYRFEDPLTPGKLTEKGLAFFICLFLEPSQAYQFLKKLKDFKDGRELIRRATVETYCCYHIRVPRPKLVSDHSTQALLMDIANELNRCPISLFDALSPENQAEFRPKVERLPDEDDDQNTEDLPQETLLTRKESRSSSLILRYLEQTPYFQRLFPQVDLGDYYYKVYEKTTLGQTLHRRLKHNLLVFGHLREYDRENRPETWLPLLKETEDNGIMHNRPEPFITDATPHYHFVEERILLWVQPEDGSGAYQPSQWASLEVKEKGAPVGQQAWLSCYDLPSLALWVHLLGEKGGASGAIYFPLREAIKNSRRFLEDIADGNFPEVTGDTPEARKDSLHAKLQATYKLRLTDIPERLMEFLCNLESADHSLKTQQRLEKMVQQTRARLEKASRERREKPKMGKYGEDVLRSGWMADWLAEDMMRFQPALPDGKGKANDSQYRILQQRLAYFGRDKTLLTDTFAELRLIDSTNPHPFLTETLVKQSAGILEFYEGYLLARKTFLEQALSAKKTATHSFLRMQVPIDGDAAKAQQLAKELLKMPINLPRGVFYGKVVEALKKLNNASLNDALDAQTTRNTAFLLKAYLSHVHQDKVQPMYHLPRNHRFADMMLDTRKNKFQGLPKHYFGTDALAASYHDWAETLRSKEKALETSGKEADEKRLAAIPRPDYNTRKQIQILQREIVAIKSLRKQFREMKTLENSWRQHQTEDIALYLVAVQLFADELNDSPLALERREKGQTPAEIMKRFPLHQIRPNQPDGQSLLSQKQVYQQKVEVNNGVRDKNKLVYREIYQPDLKLKNFGDFRRFMLDRRLPEMLFYYPANAPVLRAAIERELVEYEQVRYQVFRAVADFEQAMLAVYGSPLEAAMQADPDHQHEAVLNYYFAQHPQPDAADVQKTMLVIRNKFSHNQFPPYSSMKDLPQFADLPHEMPGILADWEARYQQPHPKLPRTLSLAKRIVPLAEATYIAFTQELRKHPNCVHLL